jgi:hypothetical protein
MNALQFEIRALDNASGVFQRFAANMQTRMRAVDQFNQSIQNGGRAVNQLVSSVVALGGVRALGNFIQQAQAARVAQDKLNQTLRSTGQYSEGYIKDLEDQADALSKKILVDDDDIKGVQRRLIQRGVERKDVEALTRLTYDLAEARGISAEAAAETLGRAYRDDALELSKLGITLDENKDRATALKSALAGAVGGQAEAAASARGFFVVLKFQFEQMAETIGGLLLPLLEPFLKGALSVITPLKEALDRLKENGEKIGPNLSFLLTTLGQIAAIAAIAFVPLVATIGLVMGAMTALSPVLNIIRVALFAILGAPFGATIAAVQALTAQFGLLATIGAGGFAAAFATALSVIAAALAGFTLGTFISKWEIGGKQISEYLAQWVLDIIQGSKEATAAVQVLWFEAIAAIKTKFAELIDMASAIPGLGGAAAKMKGYLGLDKDSIENDKNARIAAVMDGLDKERAITIEAKAQIDKEVSDRRKERDAEAARKPSVSANPDFRPGAGVSGGKSSADAATEAEQRYQAQLQVTNDLKQLGAITDEQARQRVATASAEYEGLLTRHMELLQQKIELAQNNGEVEKVNELKLKYDQLHVSLLQVQQAQQGQGFLGQFNLAMQQAGQSALNLGRNLGGILSQGISGVGNAFASAITGTQNFGQAMQQVAMQVISSLISMIVQALIWFAILTALDAAFPGAGKALAATAGGVASIVGGMGFAKGGVVKAAGGRFIGQGTSDTADDVPAMLSRGEFVVRASAVRALGLGAMNMINQGQMPTVASPDYEAAGQVERRSGETNVAVFDDRKKMKQWLQGKEGRKIVQDSTTGRRFEMGIGT